MKTLSDRAKRKARRGREREKGEEKNERWGVGLSVAFIARRMGLLYMTIHASVTTCNVFVPGSGVSLLYSPTK
jgi:hypothetical protein